MKGIVLKMYNDGMEDLHYHVNDNTHCQASCMNFVSKNTGMHITLIVVSCNVVKREHAEIELKVFSELVAFGEVGEL